MVWRDSRGRFVRVPKTAIKAVAVAVYPTRDVAKNWDKAPLLKRATEAVRDAVTGLSAKFGASGWASEVPLQSAVSFDQLADILEYQSAGILDLDLEGARIWLGVRLKDGRVVPLSKAYSTTEETIAQAIGDLRNQLSRYLPEDAEDDEPEEPEELPPEPIRYAVRDAKGRFVKRG